MRILMINPLAIQFSPDIKTEAQRLHQMKWL